MPRKVLIDKNTLQEILAKYQGGGSGGGSVNVESNIVDIKFTSVEGILHFYFWKEKWNEFLQSKSLTEQQFLDGFNNANSKLELFSLFNQLFSPLAKLVGVLSFYQSVQVYDGDNNEFYAEKPLVFIKPYVDDLDNPTYITLTVYCLSGVQDGEGNPNAKTDSFMLLNSDYNATFTVSVSTLDIVNVTGGQGGGTVEAEPIVSIKMTNLDGATTDTYADGTILYDVQLYCTKDKWNEFVAYAKQMYDVDVTYSNFGTVFTNSNADGQFMFFMMMLKGYYEDKKTFPPFYITDVNNKIDMSLVSMQKDQYGNYSDVPIITRWYKGGINQTEIFPSADRSSVPYTTASSVITVEEISGPAIGSSSGTSDDRLPTPTSSDAGKEIYATEDGKYAFADVFHFTVADFENINVYFINSPTFEAQAITAMNTMIDSTNSQYGTSIPNISSFNDIYGLFSYLKSNNLTAVFKSFYATLFTYISTLGVKTIYSVLLPVNGQVTLLNTSSVNNMLVAGDMVFWYQKYNATTEQLELHKSIPLTTDGLAEVDYNGIRTLLS